MRRLKTQIRKFWLPALLVPFLMTLPALSQSNGDTQECQGTTVDLQGEAVAQKSRTFLSELQAGVSKGDKAKVAAMISYPLLVIRRTGKTRMLVGVYGQNHAAIAFYKRVGFSVVGERKFQVGATLHDDLILALAL